MTTHYDDEAQAERLKQWWKDNWMALAGGLVIGLAAIFGWEGWHKFQDSRAATASRMYEDLKVALAESRRDEALQVGAALQREYARTPYAAGAALYLASDAVQAGQLDAALQQLGWARQHASDESLRDVARLREARVLWQQGQTEQALDLLKNQTARFSALAEELRGDIRLSQGDRAAARSAYEKALAVSAEDDLAARSSLQRKLDDLADVVRS